MTRSLGTKQGTRSYKDGFGGKFDPLMDETFLECETIMSRATTWTHFVEILAEIDPRKVVEVVRHKKTTPLRPIISRSPKPIARFRCKCARLSLFKPQPHVPNFIQIDPSFRELLAKTTFQIVTLIFGSFYWSLGG